MRPDVATFEMKLAKTGGRPGTAGPSCLADLKIGMNSVNRSGIQQNTTCFFDKQYPKVKPVPKVDKNVNVPVLCKGHNGVRKPHKDQNNPYTQRKNYNYFKICFCINQTTYNKYKLISKF